MACRAILRSTFLAVTREATTHVVIHGFFGDAGFRHVAVTGGARDTRLIVGRVLEFHMRRSVKKVDALPRNFNFLVGVADYFLDFRFIAA